ncbi:tubby-like F-box protein 3 [Wolffia australiana]
MSLRSIIHDVREEIGNLSKKRTDSKRAGYGFQCRSRPKSLVHPSPMGRATDEEKKNLWASVPVELLREVLARIEDSSESWPQRKSVVACAGVCTSWRRIVKEIVDSTAISQKFTFPVSLKQPCSRDSFVQCFIKRNRSKQTYHLYLGLTPALAENGKFLLVGSRSRHLTCTDYIISTDPTNICEENESYAGKLRSNFLGTKFVVYDSVPSHTGPIAERNRSVRLRSKQVLPRIPSGNYPVAHVNYELNVLNSRGPRKMQCTMDTMPLSAMKEDVDSLQATMTPLTPSKPCQCDAAAAAGEVAAAAAGEVAAERVVLENKAPRWHELLQCWCLNFRGRVTVASVKNFQLVGPDKEKVVLQFGKVGKDTFTMDYQYPLSAFQAFAICLSSFDAKIICK